MSSTKPEESSQQSLIMRYMPILTWLRRYPRTWLSSDILVGITLWGTMIPTSMGYAQMAGLPVEAGLYASMVALFGYAVFGTSTLLKVGASASMAIMSAAIVAPMAGGNQEYAITLSAALALMVGVILIIAGLARMGYLADFLSKPVVSGFLFGLALMIIIYQLPRLFGLPQTSGNIFSQLWELITSLGETNPYTLAISVVAILVLLLSKRYFPRVPGSLIVLIFGVLAGLFLNLEEHGVELVGQIPGGLPVPKIPLVGLSDLLSLVVGAAGIVFVVLGESLGIARKIAVERRHRIDDNQELIALGVANLGTGLFQGFTVGANPAATESAKVGRGKTQITSIVTALLIVFTLITRADLLAYLPEAVLSVAVILSVSHLLDRAELRRFYHSQKVDFALAITALVGVLVAGILPGLLIAVFLSLGIVLYQSSRSHIAVLGRLSGHHAYVDVHQNPDAEQISNALILRIDVPLFFANARTVHNQIRSLISSYSDTLEVVVLDLGVSTDLDLTSTDMLEVMIEDLHSESVDLLLARVRSTTRSRLQRTGLQDRIGEENYFLSVQGAVEDLMKHRSMPSSTTDEEEQRGTDEERDRG